jgi:hypothetical protein
VRGQSSSLGTLIWNSMRAAELRSPIRNFVLGTPDQ